jgi:hypothetical protein
MELSEKEIEKDIKEGINPKKRKGIFQKKGSFVSLESKSYL